MLKKGIKDWVRKEDFPFIFFVLGGVWIFKYSSSIKNNFKTSSELIHNIIIYKD